MAEILENWEEKKKIIEVVPHPRTTITSFGHYLKVSFQSISKNEFIIGTHTNFCNMLYLIC